MGHAASQATDALDLARLIELALQALALGLCLAPVLPTGEQEVQGERGQERGHQADGKDHARNVPARAGHQPGACVNEQLHGLSKKLQLPALPFHLRTG